MGGKVLLYLLYTTQLNKPYDKLCYYLLKVLNTFEYYDICFIIMLCA